MAQRFSDSGMLLNFLCIWSKTGREKKTKKLRKIVIVKIMLIIIRLLVNVNLKVITQSCNHSEK